jgi:hypothetical protein
MGRDRVVPAIRYIGFMSLHHAISSVRRTSYGALGNDKRNSEPENKIGGQLLGRRFELGGFLQIKHVAF